MLIGPQVSAHLEKYFSLAQQRYSTGDWPLATFFALTVMEECGKLLVVRDAPSDQAAERPAALDHDAKYGVAVVNLLTANERFDKLPVEWQDEAWSWLEEGKLAQLRNRSLYLRFDRRGKLFAPADMVKADVAALLVYLAGEAMAELDEYVSGLRLGWAEEMRHIADEFRARFLAKER